jgi:hypothetical protein
MTEEKIRAIRKAQADMSEFEAGQRAELDLRKDKVLTPLVKACDHTYPWGETALYTDDNGRRRYCRICYGGIDR